MQLVRGGRGELVMQKRVAGAEDEEGDDDGGDGVGDKTLEKYVGVKVKVRPVQKHARRQYDVRMASYAQQTPALQDRMLYLHMSSGIKR